jgi:hypothetical protein
MSTDAYKDTCLLIHDISKHSAKPKGGGRIYHYHKSEALNRFPQKGILVQDLKDKMNNPRVPEWRNGNFLKTGVLHGMCTLTNALHITINMGYNKIIFVGVDLNDSRYFWLGKSTTRHSVKQKGHNYKHSHATLAHVVAMVHAIKGCYPDVSMYIYSRTSRLHKDLPKWQWD